MQSDSWLESVRHSAVPTAGLLSVHVILHPKSGADSLECVSNHPNTNFFGGARSKIYGFRPLSL